MSEDKRTATQKIDDLEKVVTAFYQNLTQIKAATEHLLKSQSDMALVKDALKLLNKKTEAIIQVATPDTGITVQSVSDIVVKMNVEDLKAQVKAFQENGHLTPTETVAANTYVVCEELNQDGTLANPRTQFRLDSIDKATADQFLDKKVGDVLSFGENKFSARMLEIYTINDPKNEQNASVPVSTETASVEKADMAPAESSEVEVPVTATLDSLPEESPVTVFVPSDLSNAVTAAS